MLPIKVIDFWKDKYGPELLVDLGRIETTLGYLLYNARPHRLTFYDIAFITGGAGTFMLDEQACPVAPNHVIFTSPGQVRRWLPAQDVTGYVLFFTADFINTFFNDALFLNKLQFFHATRTPLHLSLAPDVFTSLEVPLRDIEREIKAMQRDSVHLLRALLYQILIKLNRLYSAAYGISADTEAHPLMHRFRLLVERYFREKHQVVAYADLLGITPDYLNDLSRQHANITAGTLIRERILVEARRYLQHSDMTIAELAYLLNFKDPSYFARFFKRYAGLSPTQFRRHCSEKHRGFPH
jgi:AraC-like DNA-binding protein